MNDTAGHLRGLHSESLVEEALRVLIETKTFIKDFLRSKQYSLEDRRGKDFVVMTVTGEQIPLQVKSSERNARKFIRHRKHDNREEIPVIVVRDSDDKTSLASRLLTLIQNALACFRKVKEKVAQIQKRRKRYGRICHAPSRC